MPSTSRELNRGVKVTRRPSWHLAGLTEAICHDTFQSQDAQASFPVCVFSFWRLTDFRRGSLKIEQARDVLTKLEKAVKLFLTVAKEPSHRLLQVLRTWCSSYSLPGNNDTIGDEIPFVFLFPFCPDFFKITFLIVFVLKLHSSWRGME